MTTQLACFGLTPWQSGVPARSEQLISRLGAHAQIIYFEPPYRGGSPKGRKVRPNVTAYTLPAPPPLTAMHAMLFRRWQAALSRYIGKVLERRRFREPVFWFASPEWYPAAIRLPHCGVVYDCFQDFSLLPCEWETELTYGCDLCFGASEDLVARLKPANDNVVLLPNGCNYPVFAGVPPRRDGRGKVLSYCGTLWDDLDLRPLIACAKVHPEWEFRLAGGYSDRFPGKQLAAPYPNIRFLGSYESREMAAILSESDVCINLLRKDEAVPDLIPNRMYEYLATGKPLVTMLFPEQIEVFFDCVYGAKSSLQFISCCERAVAETGEALPTLRRRHAQQANWSGRAERVMELMASIGLYDINETIETERL